MSWVPYSEVDFADEGVMQYHIDTRDFHCATNNNPLSSDKQIDLSKIKNYPDRFFHTADEVVRLLDKLFSDSGGKAEWRFLMLNSDHKYAQGWSLKYLRIYRTQYGLIVCSSNNHALNKQTLLCDVDQEHLNAY